MKRKLFEYHNNLTVNRKYGVDHRKLKPEEVLVTADKVSGNDNSDVITHRDMRKLHSIVPLGL